MASKIMTLYKESSQSISAVQLVYSMESKQVFLYLSSYFSVAISVFFYKSQSVLSDDFSVQGFSLLSRPKTG